MKNTMKSLLAASAIAFSAWANALPVTINWAPQTFDVASSDFNEATMTFGAITANELVSIQGPSSPQVHSHGGAMTWAMELNLDGIWTSILSGSFSGSGTHFFSGLYNDAFATSSVTGIRFTSNPDQQQSYHGWGGASFTFNNVPAPATLAMLALGLLGVGFARRKTT